MCSWELSFFRGHGEFVESVPDAMSGDLGMSPSFGLCSIGMSPHMTTQVLPIERARTARTGALVDEAVRLEPSVHAGLTHL